MLASSGSSAGPGSRAWERLWLPLLRAKLGDNAEVASAAFIWAIIARMYGARRTGMKRETFGYVEGGYAAILERFDEHLARLGVESIYGRRVTQVRSATAASTSRCPNGERDFDNVVLTIPCSRVAASVPQLTEQSAIVCVASGTRASSARLFCSEQPLADYYITNITDARVPFTAVIEMTALVDREPLRRTRPWCTCRSI